MNFITTDVCVNSYCILLCPRREFFNHSWPGQQSTIT